MRPTNDAIEHCRSHIERTRAALQRREALGRDTYDLRRHLKTLEALLAVHKAARDAAPARPSSKPLPRSRPEASIRRVTGRTAMRRRIRPDAR